MGCLLTIFGLFLLAHGCGCNNSESFSMLEIGIALILLWLANND